MVTAEPAHGEGDIAAGPKMPPVDWIAVASMVLVVTGGIYLSSYLPRAAPLGPVIILLVAGGLLTLWNVVALSRLGTFAWERFFLVGRWTLLAYAFIAGMLEYVFVADHTRGGALVVMTLMLAVFAIDVPMLLAFSVARYQEIGKPAER